MRHLQLDWTNVSQYTFIYKYNININKIENN